MAVYIVIIVIAAILLAALIYEKAKYGSVRVLYIKTAVSVCFVLTAFAGTYTIIKSGSSDGSAGMFPIFIMSGLLFGLLGDIWLALKGIHKEETTAHTYAGFISFLIGHLLYIAGLIVCFGDGSRILYIILPIIIGIAAGFFIGFSGKLLRLEFGGYKAIVIIYGSLLAGMTLLEGSLTLMNGWHNATLNMMFAGGILFLASDLILSRIYFGSGIKNMAAYTAANLITYYGAQFVIALSLTLLG